MSAAIRTSKRAVGLGRLLGVGDDHAVQARRASRAYAGLELDADDLDVLAPLERGARRAGRAAEVQHAPGGRRDVLEDLRPGALVGRGAGGAFAGTHHGNVRPDGDWRRLDSSAMAGHSKWAGIKHKKAIVDSRRGKLFTKLARAITVAAKEGGGDIVGNAALGLAVQKAKDASMPKDNIERAIAKGTGAGADADTMEAVMYEGYGPGGVAMLVEAFTDNRNRTGSEIRHAFAKHGGNLGEPGSVAYLFDKKGVVVVDGEKYSEDDLMPALDAGAEDIVLDDDVLRDPLRAVRSDRDARRAGRRRDRGRRGRRCMQRPKTLVPLDEDGADEADEADRHARGPRRHRHGARELRRRRRDPGAGRGLEPCPYALRIFRASIVTRPLHSIAIAGVQCAHVTSQPPCSRCCAAR